MNVENMKKRLEFLRWSLDEASLRLRPLPCSVMWVSSPLGERHLLIEEGAYYILLAHVRQRNEELHDRGIAVRRLQNFSLWTVTRGAAEALEILETLARTEPSSDEWVQVVCGGCSLLDGRES